jgi:hypothetical protein
MFGFAAFAVLSIVGIVAAITWISVVSLGIRRDERVAVLKVSRLRASGIGTSGTGPGRMARIARQTTGVHWT